MPEFWTIIEKWIFCLPWFSWVFPPFLDCGLGPPLIQLGPENTVFDKFAAPVQLLASVEPVGLDDNPKVDAEGNVQDAEPIFKRCYIE